MRNIRGRLKSLLSNRTARSSAINVIIKPISMLLALVSTPLLLSYLGDEKYGLWATILSVTSWINYCDVGVGNGLRNLLSKQIAKRNYNDAEKSISTAYICLTGVSLTILAVLIVFSIFIDWKNVFKTSIDLQLTMIITFVFICINFILALSNTVLYAMQLSETVSFRNVLMHIINIFGLVFLKQFSEGNLVYVAILFGAGTTLTYLINSINIWKKYKFFRPRLKTYDRGYVKEICSVGIKFFVMQIAAVVLFTTDNIIITRLFGSEAVTPCSMFNKIYNTGYGFFTAITVPIWSASTEALAKKNYEWFDKVLRKLNIVALVFFIGYVLVGIAFKPLAAIWLQRELDYPDGLILVMIIYYLMQTISVTYGSVNNGIGALNGQVVLGIIQGIVNVPMSIFLARNCGLGVVGVKLATAMLVGVGAIFQPIYYHITIDKLRKQAHNNT